MALRLIAFPIINAAVLVLARRTATTSAKAADDRTRRSALNKAFLMVRPSFTLVIRYSRFTCLL